MRNETLRKHAGIAIPGLGEARDPSKNGPPFALVAGTLYGAGVLRHIVYRFDDLLAFAKALKAGDLELALPKTEKVADAEWVLAIFEIAKAGEKRETRATASAARGLDRGAQNFVLSFERRDWERLVRYADSDGRDEFGRESSPPSAPPVSIPVAVEEPIGRGPSSSRSRVPKSKTTHPMSTKQKAASEREAPPAPPRSSGSFRASGSFAAGLRARVLLVDDDRDIRDVVGAMLDAVGLSVEAATSAEEALERVRAQTYDLLVLDWNLPGMTGLELCRVIRREEALAGLPILFLTAHASSRDIVEAFASGADDYVVKPFRAPELGARIFGLLRRLRAATTSE